MLKIHWDQVSVSGVEGARAEGSSEVTIMQDLVPLENFDFDVGGQGGALEGFLAEECHGLI